MRTRMAWMIHRNRMRLTMVSTTLVLGDLFAPLCMSVFISWHFLFFFMKGAAGVDPRKPQPMDRDALEIKTTTETQTCAAGHGTQHELVNLLFLFLAIFEVMCSYLHSCYTYIGTSKGCPPINENAEELDVEDGNILTFFLEIPNPS